MLVLSRKVGEKIRIGKDIVITFVGTRERGTVRIGITAPKDTPILRAELPERKQKPEAA